MTNELFHKQHVYLKLCFVVMVLLAVCFLHTGKIGWLILLNICFFLPDKNINLLYFKTLLRLSLFWIMYLFFGILFNIPYDKQVDFLL